MKFNEKNLNAFAKTPPFDMKGFLNKRGEVNKAFQRRFFILKGNLLFYFESLVDKDPLGLIIVEGCTIELSNEVDNYCFEIAFNCNRTYIFSADNQESMETWMKVLTCAGYEYKRIILDELKRQIHEMEDSKNIFNSAEKRANTFGRLPNDWEAVRPRRPPRRTNPFNRPAPPSPSSLGDVVMSPLPFINGYIGSSNACTQQGKLDVKQDAYSNERPSRTPREQRCPTVATAITTRVFYQDAKKERQRRRIKALNDFALNHERFRKELMGDVSAYRERLTQPLIKL
ncbi:sesquipedalian-1 [Drosophila biarmipes]|uniref:sesquipedalian-1 n=1 Tax=Drosophila biarmipes TaxID=125945 RepID=UPI0007E74D29|nr:sesquipedalian-1 [Drosophila biarmipes]